MFGFLIPLPAIAVGLLHSVDDARAAYAVAMERGVHTAWNPDEDAEKITRVKEAVEYIESHAKSKK